MGKHTRGAALVLLALVGCGDGGTKGRGGNDDSATDPGPGTGVTGTGTGVTTGVTGTGTGATGSGGVATDVTEVTIEAGFQDADYGEFKRGRAMIVTDFDNDGRHDVYLGNPGDPSHILHNVTEPGDPHPRLVPWIVLSDDKPWWGATAADYDNDGDADLFISAGGNEVFAFDFLLRNDLVDGVPTFVDVTEQAGVKGKKINGDIKPMPSAGAAFIDYDNDADLDIYVSHMILPPGNIKQLATDDLRGINTMWRNNGDGTFTDVTVELGLHTSSSATQNSTAFDMDNDGDLDIYECNFETPNVMWRNRLVEEGAARFVDVTAGSGLGTDDLSWPERCFASATADFNNDGWLDLLVYVRAFEPGDTVYPDGHVIYLNVEGQGMVDVAGPMKINNPFANWPLTRSHASRGVMGAQVGDLNLDGYPDVFIGQGGPPQGTVNQLYVSGGTTEVDVPGHGTFTLPVFDNWTTHIDHPAPVDPSLGLTYPGYPYRTHGSAITDLDDDGVPELMISNGGIYAHPDEVQEPNRMFKFVHTPAQHWLKVQVRGDGVVVDRSAIGARVAVHVTRDSDGASWVVHGVQTSVSGFAANNGLEVFFGLADADRVDKVEVTWHDRTTTVQTDVPIDSRVFITR